MHCIRLLCVNFPMVTHCLTVINQRCFRLPPNPPLVLCPFCNNATSGIALVPMSFTEIDEARKAAAAAPAKKGRKRKGDKDQDPDHNFGDPSDRRTGRWTADEVAYCDKLSEKFTSGELPVEEKTKLNEFLGNMLKSKQSRLTKKMKNASLSQKCFQRTTGCIVDPNDARAFARLEEGFFMAIQSLVERAEMRFHVQKEWRELFSTYCVALGQPLDADEWLGSVEEMDRRAAQARENARNAKRRVMMSNALTHDTRNSESGVFIDRMQTGVSDALSADDLMSLLSGGKQSSGASKRRVPGRTYDHGSPFLSKVVDYVQRNGVPFEHIDVWVPSFVPPDGSGEASSEAKCRLCFAGCATTEFKVANMGGSDSSQGPPPELLTPQEQVSLFGFGEYSQKFSFNVGCGLPGRVYQSGIPTWEQSVQNAPHHHFERCGGAMQWGVKTVVGLPIPSPNVGRIVVVLYSCLDRPKNHDLVGKLCEEFAEYCPEPKWKLVVDLGEADEGAMTIAEPQPGTSVFSGGAQVAATATSSNAAVNRSDGSGAGNDSRVSEIITLLGEHMPSDPSSPHSSYLPGFMSLRLLLLRSSRTQEENEFIQTLLSSYTSYSSSGRSEADIALMLARDFLFLKQHAAQAAAASGQARQHDTSNGSSIMGANQVANQGVQQMIGLPIIPQNPSPLSPVHEIPGGGSSVPPIQLPGAAGGASGPMSFSGFPSPATGGQQQNPDGGMNGQGGM